MGHILYTSGKVRSVIIDIFSQAKGRRVAIVGFVGEGAEAYLPKPNGIELICWPKAGGTNPNSLRRLAKKGVTIRFADSLHMKVYWTEDRGAVVTSANLSTNALGSGSLKELGVKLGRGELDIDKVIASVNSRPMEAGELRRLDRQHALLMANHEGIVNGKNKVSFRTWLKSVSPQQWKLLVWTEYVGLSKTVKGLIETQYARSSADDWVTFPNGYLREADWVMTCRWSGSQLSKVQWMFVDHIVRLPAKERGYTKECPFEAVQVWPDGRYPSPPFKLDKRFREGFKKAVKEFGVERLEAMKRGTPPKGLIQLLEEFCG